MTEFDFYYFTLSICLLGTAIVYFSYKVLEYGNKLAIVDGIICSVCKKRNNRRKRLLAKAEKLKQRKKKCAS